MQHLALLGDSILDNSPYTAPEPDTADHLQRALGPNWTVELFARDGSTMADLRFQVSHLPPRSQLGVLSIGGNDAVDHIGILDEPAPGTKDVLARLAAITEDFRIKYDHVLRDLQPRFERLVVCTIYEPPLADPLMARLARVPLSLLNDQIVRAATAACVDVLDLRAVCRVSTDFVKEIEPSAQGAKKIAAAIAGLLEIPGRPSVHVFAG
jgi:hypothetical protein